MSLKNKNRQISVSSVLLPLLSLHNIFKNCFFAFNYTAGTVFKKMSHCYLALDPYMVYFRMKVIH